MVENRIFGRQCVPFRFIEEAFGTLQTGHAASLRDVFWAQNHTSESGVVQVKPQLVSLKSSPFAARTRCQGMTRE
jgi:hypothetical protein